MNTTMKKNQQSFRSQTRRGLAIALLMVAVCGAIALGVCSCKAWRTISTTSTYVQQNDSAQGKTTTTISTKTVEEYQGVKK